MITILLLQTVLGQSIGVTDSVATPPSAATPIVSPSQAILLDLPVAKDSAPSASAPAPQDAAALPAPVPVPKSDSGVHSASAVPPPPPPPAPGDAYPGAPAPDGEPPAALPGFDPRPMPGPVVRELDGPGMIGCERRRAHGPARPCEGSWQIGAVAGDAGGHGISLRRWFGEYDAIQLNLAPYMHRRNIPGTDDPNDRDRDLDSGFQLEASITVGLTWMRSHLERPVFRGNADLRVLSYVAASTEFAVDQQQIDHIVVAQDGAKSVVYNDYYRTTKEFCMGGGGGLELAWWRLSLTGLAGFDGWYEGTSENFGFNPDFQLGAHFRF